VTGGRYSTTVPAGSVIVESPAEHRSVARGTTVTLVPSLGKPFVIVPQLRGKRVVVAERRLRRLGLLYVVYGRSRHGRVVDMEPVAGARLRVGSTVTLFAF
jgi:serine/threonine-protein kinase